MSAIEEIQTAIEKLAAMQGEYTEINGWLTEIQESSTYPSYPEPVPLTNDPMIVTLHRTIDAQLATLQASIADRSPGYFDYELEAHFETVLALPLLLARAINGATS